MSKMDAQIIAADAAPPSKPIKGSFRRDVIALRDFFMPLAIIGGLLVLVLALGVHYSVKSFDAANERREQTLVHNGIDKRVKEVAMMVVPQADWDDAISNLDNHFDATWARANVGSFLYQTNGFNRAFIIDRDDALLAGYVDGTPAPANAYAPVAPGAGALVRSVRALEGRRAPLQRGGGDKMISSPIQASALKLVDGKLVVMTATLVQPDFGTALPSGPRAPIIVTTMPVDRAFLQLFADRYLLQDLHLLAAGQNGRPGETHLAARDEQGNLLASFAWTPLNPGYSMLRDMMVPIGAVSLLVILVALMQLRQIRRLAGQLIEREAFWREVANQGVSGGILPKAAFVEQLAFEIECLGEVWPTLAVLDIRPQPAGLEVHQRGQFRQIVADRLKNICREDAVVAQLDDESFAILSVGAAGPGAQALKKRVLKSLEAPISFDGEALPTSPQVGIAIVSSAAQDASAVLAQAAADGAAAG